MRGEARGPPRMAARDTRAADRVGALRLQAGLAAGVALWERWQTMNELYTDMVRLWTAHRSVVEPCPYFGSPECSSVGRA